MYSLRHEAERHETRAAIALAPSYSVRLVFNVFPICTCEAHASQATKLRPRLFAFAHAAMATTFTLYLYAEDQSRASAISEEVFDEVDRVEQMLSNYRDTSELARINRNAATGAVTTDPEMMSFLTQAQHWSRVSDGAFDITVGRLMNAWGFYRHQGVVPTVQALAEVGTVTGWSNVELDVAAGTVRFLRDGIELDQGGIGKGFAVDAAVRILRDDRVRAALLSAGSSTVYALGAPPGRRDWRVVVRGPIPSAKPCRSSRCKTSLCQARIAARKTLRLTALCTATSWIREGCVR